MAKALIDAPAPYAHFATEREFQATVIDLARTYHWLLAHFRPARTATGWRTPVEADGAGFPDLVLLRGRRGLVIELKSQRGRLSDAQQGWLEAFGQIATWETYVFRPSDWDEIVEVLTQ